MPAPYPRALGGRMCVLEILDRFSDLGRSSTIEHIYAYITHENNVIIVSYLRHRYILMGYYVSALKYIKMKEEKLDISPFLYIVLMIAVFYIAL